MARAKSTESIPPFPADLDRDSFGHWLSGFADGEAHFSLASRTSKHHPLPTPCAAFVIKLRADDVDVLRLVQSYFRCGHLVIHQRRPDPTRLGTKPTATYRVTRAADLFCTVASHFDHFPLRAKKLSDFRIWRKGVELFYTVAQRPRRRRPAEGLDRLKGRAIGCLPRWTDDEKLHYSRLVSELQAVRRYAPAA